MRPGGTVVGAGRLLQLASRNPIRYGPHDQYDQNADCHIIRDYHDTPAPAGNGCLL